MKISRFAIIVLSMLAVILAACGTQPPPPTVAPSGQVEVKDIAEDNQTSFPIIQVKRYNQCESDSSLKTQIQFSQSDTDSNQKELTLAAKVSGGADISGVAKVQLEGSIQNRFSSVNTTAKGYNEVLQIEIPAHTFLEYTITWKETRQEGTIQYVEDGQTKTVDYSYRIGLQLDTSSTRKLPCPTPDGVTSTLEPTPVPPTPTPMPKTLTDGCISAATWKIDSTDENRAKAVTPNADNCYPLDEFGIFANKSGTIFLSNARQNAAISSGIFTPINSDSKIEFKVYVKTMYIANVLEGNSSDYTYVTFAVAPASDPMNKNSSARFKIEVDKPGDKAFVYFRMADLGEEDGTNVQGRHYEFKTYTVSLQLNGNTMNVSINGIPVKEKTLSLPNGPKVFYIGYKLPVRAGIEAQVSNLSIDGASK